MLQNNDLKNVDVIEFMRSRRSVPAKLMAGPGPDESQVRTILQIASRVPDHGKLSPWRFIHYGEQKCRSLGELVLKRAQTKAQQEGRQLNEEWCEIERNRFVRVPTVIAVVCRATTHPKIPEWEQILSSGAVAMNMLIAANALGFDAQWLTEWIAYDEELRSDLGLSAEERIAGFIHIGTRQNPRTERNRPNLDEIYTFLDN